VAAESRFVWVAEALERETFPSTGSRVVQLTSLPVTSHNIYLEQPYCTADGKRFVFIRYTGTNWYDGPYELWLCDIDTLRIRCLAPRIENMGMAASAYGNYFHAVALREGRRRLVRYSLRTAESESVFDLSELPRFQYGIGSVSTDQRFYLNWILLEGGRQGVVRLDMTEKSWKVIHEGHDIFNTHMQFSLPGAEDILIQQNRGGRLDANGILVKDLGEEGCALYVIDREGGNRRPLPVGKPLTPGASGHECWVRGTGEVLFTVAHEGLSRATRRPERWRGASTFCTSPSRVTGKASWRTRRWNPAAPLCSAP